MFMTRAFATTAITPVLILMASGQIVAEDFDQTGFSISYGGETIAGATPPFRPGQAPVDREFRLLDLNVQFDTLARTRLLNVLTEEQRQVYQAGDEVTFRASTNYPAYIARAEVQIYDRTRPGRRQVATLPIRPNGTVTWVMPADGPEDLGYTLRVYDGNGRFDETIPAHLHRSDRPVDPGGASSLYHAPGEGEDRTAIRNIRVRGGTVIISANNAIPGDTVRIGGDAVPVDASGSFVVSRILPVGDNVVEIDAYGRRLLRDVHVPQTDWFRTGLIDITAGLRHGGPNDSEDTYLDGRAAFYVNGYTAQGWNVTASADTTYGPLEDVFTRLDDRDPLRVLDTLRSDGTDLYPTYGDDSTWYDSTPTSGNVYLRLETDTTALAWGDFTAQIEGPGLIRTSRDLYGASLDLRSPGTTADGRLRYSASVYAALPDSLPQRDILRGTGGSLYFLSRRDVIGGSATIRVEETDAVTGFVTSSRTLVEGEDYVVDYLQGVVILTRPLSSGGEDGSVISGAGDEQVFNLVVQYEYVPSGEIGDASYGGRAEGWIGDQVRLGATLMSDETGAGRHDVMSVDTRLEFGEASFIELELAQSDGPGFGRSTSTDGGLTSVEQLAGVANQSMAFELRGALQFSDLGLNADGGITAYAQIRDEGFETLTESTAADQELYGLTLDLGISERLRFGAAIEDFSRETGERRSEGEISLTYRLTDIWSVTAALAHEDRVTLGEPDETGDRTDAALRLTYEPNEDFLGYAFAQGTLDRSGGLASNNRAGFGAVANIGDRVSVSGEVSGGDGGLAADARASWRPNDNGELYIGYSLDPTLRSRQPGERDRGRLVAGTAYTYSEQVRVFNEFVYAQPGHETSLTQVYGVTYTPSQTWALSGGLEAARIEDGDSGDFDRLGVSLGIAWSPDDDRAAHVRLEYRTEDGDGADRDRDTWAISGSYSYQLADDWRLLANVDAIFSDAEEGPLADAEYLSASIGYAYRPIANERLNVLSRLIYIQDTSPEDQRSGSGATDGPQQRSTVFSIGANYDLNERLTVTGNLGFRASEIAERGSDDFFADTATLGVVRFDYEVLAQWDVMAEGRMLYTEETDITESGAVLGIYRHINDTVSIGGGVEWGSVSGDPTVIDYDAQGLFLNLVGRF
ncbi:hypothetical protein V8J82_21760 [Gymnodinialimonas sp. 2305UL16-5]|uniref:hypothetical protein n=1 Tax=Gymnodinialimonas mytili TaxID=3126503 RepID=UPI00309639AF